MPHFWDCSPSHSMQYAFYLTLPCCVMGALLSGVLWPIERMQLARALVCACLCFCSTSTPIFD